MAEDSKRQTEEPELPSDPSSQETEKSDETKSESPSKLNSDHEINDGNDAANSNKTEKSADPEIHNQDNTKNSEKQVKTVSTDNEKIGDDDHSFNLHVLVDNDLFNKLKSKKDQIFRYTAAAIGVILIIYGVVLISASVTKVADNVIFGEGASFAAFSMLLGFLIIVGAFSQKILNKTFLKNINSELKIAEEKSDSKDEKIEKVNDITDNKKDKDNNGNILGEDKK